MRIKDMRKRKGMTQQELAELSGVSRNVIANLETGRNKPTYETAQAIASVLGCKWYKVFDEQKETSEQETSNV